LLALYIARKLKESESLLGLPTAGNNNENDNNNGNSKNMAEKWQLYNFRQETVARRDTQRQRDRKAERERGKRTWNWVRTWTGMWMWSRMKRSNCKMLAILRLALSVCRTVESSYVIWDYFVG